MTQTVFSNGDLAKGAALHRLKYSLNQQQKIQPFGDIPRLPLEVAKDLLCSLVQRPIFECAVCLFVCVALSSASPL